MAFWVGISYFNGRGLYSGARERCLGAISIIDYRADVCLHFLVIGAA